MEERPEPFTRHGTKEQPIEVSADEILNAIAEGRDVDVGYAVVAGDLDIKRIKDSFDLNENDKAIIRTGMKIQHSEISGDVCFSHVILKGDIDFGRSAFKGNADFSFSVFGEKQNLSDKNQSFYDVRFSFYEAVFAKGADFSYTVFYGHADLNYAFFGGFANFTTTTFSGEANLAAATFNGSVNFSDANFSNDAGFYYTNFNGDVDFKYAIFQECVDFTGVSVRHPAIFANVRLRENTVFKGLWNLTIGRIKRLRWTVTDFSGFNTNTVMDASSNPYLKRYIEDEQWIASWRQQSWWRKVFFFFWELTSHCGRSFTLWMFWALALATGFAQIYNKLGNEHIAFNVAKFLEEGTNPDFWSYLYYSAVTFTTLGFGDIIPLTNLGRLIVGIEVFLGYLMLGGLISIFANKFARRS